MLKFEANMCSLGTRYFLCKLNFRTGLKAIFRWL